jgi:hypothetical protein
VKWGFVFTAVAWLWHHSQVQRPQVPLSVNSGGGTSGPVTQGPLAPQVQAASLPIAQAIQQKVSLSDLSSVPVPTNLKGELRSGQKVLFTWDPVPHCFYNFYSRASWSTSFTKENSQPLQHPTALWASDSGTPDVYHFVVTAVNGQDQESVYSPEYVVDTRPKP